ncbi:hypothetical protein D3C76_1688420 [compost metagenome]
MKQARVHILETEPAQKPDPAADRQLRFFRIPAFQPFRQPPFQLLRNAKGLVRFVGVQPVRFKNRSFTENHAVVGAPHRQIIMLRQPAVILEHSA